MITGGSQWLQLVSTPMRKCEKIFSDFGRKTYENVSLQLEIVIAKSVGHIKIDDFAVRIVFS